MPQFAQSAPSRELDVERTSRRQVFEDVLLIAEVVSVSDRHGIPVYLVVDPYAGEVVVRARPTGDGCIAAYTHKYGTGKLPIELADGRTFTLDLDE